MTERRTREGFAPSRFAIVAALGIGVAIAVVDMLPNWDDTGITAGALFAVAAALGFSRRLQPWLAGLAVGSWVPLCGIVAHRNYASLIALAVAFAGAYAGAAARRLHAS